MTYCITDTAVRDTFWDDYYNLPEYTYAGQFGFFLMYILLNNTAKENTNQNRRSSFILSKPLETQDHLHECYEPGLFLFGKVEPWKQAHMKFTNVSFNRNLDQKPATYFSHLSSLI